MRAVCAQIAMAVLSIVHKIYFRAKIRKIIYTPSKSSFAIFKSWALRGLDYIGVLPCMAHFGHESNTFTFGLILNVLRKNENMLYRGSHLICFHQHVRSFNNTQALV